MRRTPLPLPTSSVLELWLWRMVFLTMILLWDMVFSVIHALRPIPICEPRISPTRQWEVTPGTRQFQCHTVG